MVKSDTIFTPQTFCEAVLGACYIFNCENTTEEIETLLDDEFGINIYRSYPLTELHTIVEKDLNVVLVDVSGFYGDEWISMYRWFEVPEDFMEVTDYE